MGLLGRGGEKQDRWFGGREGTLHVSGRKFHRSRGTADTSTDVSIFSDLTPWN